MTTYTIGTRDGFAITAEIVPDTDTNVTEFDIYDAATIDAYHRGDWGYVGIIVTASNGDVSGTDSIWGVEYGQFPKPGSRDWLWVDPLRDDNGSLAYYRADLIDNAVADARMQLAALTDSEV